MEAEPNYKSRCPNLTGHRHTHQTNFAHNGPTLYTRQTSFSHKQQKSITLSDKFTQNGQTYLKSVKPCTHLFYAYQTDVTLIRIISDVTKKTVISVLSNIVLIYS